MTALEVAKGLLSSSVSDRKCLLFIREIICNEEQVMQKLDKAGFYNDKDIDNKELEDLKKKAINKLSGKNVFKLNVI